MAAKFPLDIVLRAIDRVSAPLKGIAGKVQMLGRTIGGMGTKFLGVANNNGLPKIMSALGGVGSAVGGVVKNVAALGAGLAAAGVIAFTSGTAMATAYADATGAIGDAAERTGATREGLQELGFAAKLTGSSFETMEGALLKMNIAVSKAKGGSKDLQQMFAGLGIKTKNANGTLKTTDQLFETFVDRISKIKDPTLQTQAAVKVFGKSATELLPLIRGGTAGLAEMREEARRLGIVISDQAVRDGEAFGDTLDTLAFALKGVGNTIGAALVPQLNKLGGVLIETIVKYRPQIEEFATSFAEKLPGNIEKVVGFMSDLYDEIQPLIKALGWLSDNFGILNTAMVLIGLTISSGLILSILNLAVALKTLGVSIALTPIGWFLAGIAAIGAAVFIIYKNWDNIGEYFTEKWASVKAAFSDGIINGMWKVWKEYNPATLMMEAFNGLIKYLTGWDIASILKEKITAAVSALSSSLPDWVKELLGIDGTIAVTAKTVEQTVGAAVAAEQAGQPNQQGRPEAGAIGQQAATGAAATPIGQRAAAIGQQAAQAIRGEPQQVLVTVDMKNAPQGTKVNTTGTPGTKFDTNLGFAQGSPSGA